MAHVFQLTLVRHGETDANKMNVCQGQMDVPLSEHGRKQALLLAETLATERFSSLYSSDLSRCTETAALIASRHENLNVMFDPRLRERSHGSLEGQPFSVVREAMRHATPKSFAAPDGEKLDQVRRRVMDFFDSMCRDYCKMCMDIQPTTPFERDPTILSRFRKMQPQSWDPYGEIRGHIVVVSHGGPIDCLLRHFRDRYGCQLSSGTLTPNTGVSSFLVRVKNCPRPTCTSVRALVIHNTSHLTPEVSGALLAHDVIHLTPEVSGSGLVTRDVPGALLAHDVVNPTPEVLGSGLVTCDTSHMTPDAPGALLAHDVVHLTPKVAGNGSTA